MSATAWLLVAPLLLAAASGLAALVADALATPLAATRVAAAGLAVSAVAFVAGAVAHETDGVANVFALGGTPAVLGAVCCGIAALCLVSGRRLARQPHGGQVAALVAFATAGSVALLAAFDLAVFVVALEIVALCGYALVAAARTKRSYEAAMKYFIQGAVATGLLAYGVAILFGAFGGTLRYGALLESLVRADSPAIATGLVLLIVALAFKLGAFPFHSWAPDAYETAPATVAAFIATVPKLAALVAALMLLLQVFQTQVPVWAPLAAILAAASIAFGNLGALRQTSFRRMLAYSGIAQVGYALVGIACGLAAPMPVIVFAASYALAACGAFLAAEAAGEGAGWDGSIAALAGLGRRRPVLAASLAVCLLSLTGIPLTVGFWGKFMLFATAAGSNLAWLAVVGVIGSVVSFGYYGGVLRAVYLDDRAPEPEPVLAEGPAEEPAEELGELVPRSVGAMAAEDAGEAPVTWPVAVIAVLVLAGGVAPLFAGLSIFASLLR